MSATCAGETLTNPYRNDVAQGSFRTLAQPRILEPAPYSCRVDQWTVHCDEHGETQACFVCRHLSESLFSEVGGLGFVASETSDRPQAWCFECDSLLQSRGGEWDTVSESVARVTLACAGCFERMRALNSRPRP